MPDTLPVVLTREEVRAVMARLQGVAWIVVGLLYGSGLRLTECLDLRVKDVDFERQQIMVRRGKGGKDRSVPLPGLVRADLSRHLETVRTLHGRDLAAGLGVVVLPEGLGRKYPNAATSWPWQFMFPAGRLCRDPRWGGPTRYRLHETAVQRAVARAVRDARLSKRASCHTFRHHADSRIMPRVCPDDAVGSGPDDVLSLVRSA
jgi:integrase